MKQRTNAQKKKDAAASNSETNVNANYGFITFAGVVQVFSFAALFSWSRLRSILLVGKSKEVNELYGNSFSSHYKNTYIYLLASKDENRKFKSDSIFDNFFHSLRKDLMANWKQHFNEHFEHYITLQHK